MLWGYIGVLVGIGAAASGLVIAVGWLLLLGMILLMFVRRRTVVSLVLIALFCFALGLLRGATYQQKLQQYAQLYSRSVTVSARAIDDGYYGKQSQLSFEAGHVFVDGQALAGKIQVSGFGVNAVFEGDEVVAEGKLYPGYGAYQARVSFAKVTVLAHHDSLISEFRRHFTSGVQTALPEPLAPFAMGLLVGQRATLPEQVKQDLLMVGLTHIIAVSGYNLTIILNASRKLFGGRSKRIATMLSVALIIVFLLISGASASIVRAAIVSMLSIMTTYYGRTIKPLNLITLAAAITAWANPFYVWSDISWYLSFLAFFGVMILAPLVHIRTYHRVRDNLLVLVALESICAETMSLPFILHNFGQMSRIGLLANVLVVTLVPLAMLLGLIAGLAGMISVFWAGLIALPAKLLLTYMLDTAHLLAGLPHIFIEGIGLSLVQMLLLYCIIATTAWLASRKTKHVPYDKITDKRLANIQGVSFERSQ